MLLKLINYVNFRVKQRSVNRDRPRLIKQAFERANELKSKRKATGKSALILPTTSPGNLGDEAVLFATVQELKDRGYDRICVISLNETQKYLIDGAESVVIPLEHNPAGEHYLAFVEFAKDFDEFFIWGADIVDGTYGTGVVLHRFTLANLACELGLKVTINSFSISANKSVDVFNGYRSLNPAVKLYCRDAISKERLEAEVGAGRALLCADLAFLLKPNHDADLSMKMAAWAKEQRANRKIVMGLNINELFCSHFDMSPDALLDMYVNCISRVFERHPNLAIAHMPHDNHHNKKFGQISDFIMSRRLNERLPAGIRDTAFIPPESMTAVEVRSIVSNLDLMFTARMHVAIASLAVGTPVFGLAYQGKFEGLYRHFDLENMYVTLDQFKDTDFAVKFLDQSIQRADAVRKQVRDRLPSIVAMARTNLDL